MSRLLESVGIVSGAQAAAYAERCRAHMAWGIDIPALAPALWQHCAQTLIGARPVIVFLAEDSDTDEDGRPLRGASFYKVASLGQAVGVIDIGQGAQSSPAREFEVLLHEIAHGKCHWGALPLLPGFERPLSVVKQRIVHNALTVALHSTIEDEASKLADEWLTMAEKLAAGAGAEVKMRRLIDVYSAFGRIRK